jgi:hypothetical protein
MTYRLPNLLIIGAQKGGTTWLHERLGNHPDIFFSKTKELEFFTQIAEARDLAAYAANFDDAGTRRYAGEATPGYFWTYDKRSKFCRINPKGRNILIPETVRETLGQDVKLIVTLRHPVHRAVSAYIHHFKQGRVEPGQRLLSIAKRFGIVDIGFYKRHLEKWERVFGPDKILTLFLDDIQKNGTGVLNKVFRYLDLPSADIAQASEKTHAGFKLVLRGSVLTIDTSDDITRAFMERRGLDLKNLPRIGPAAIQRLQEIYMKDIEYIEKKFRRRDLLWHETPKIEDFVGGSPSSANEGIGLEADF